jgi:hypothetical protein
MVLIPGSAYWSSLVGLLPNDTARVLVQGRRMSTSRLDPAVIFTAATLIFVFTSMDG